MLSNPTYCVNLSQSSCEESQKLLHSQPSRDVVAIMLYAMYTFSYGCFRYVERK